VQNLPEDADTPLVRELTLELPVVSVALTGDTSATVVVDRVADALRNLPGVATVTVSGAAQRKPMRPIPCSGSTASPRSSSP
jgi:multidrug efflux pump subunit AcrB